MGDPGQGRYSKGMAMKRLLPASHATAVVGSSRHLAGSRRRQAAYAGLLVLGIALPYSRFIPWLVEHGVDLPRFRDELLANRIGGFFGWDVAVAVVGLLAVASADPELRPAQRWLVALGSLGGASVGLPLYLLLREGNRRGAA